MDEVQEQPYKVELEDGSAIRLFKFDPVGLPRKLAEGDVFCDPKDKTYVAAITTGQIKLTLNGLWSGGPNLPFWGPTGEPGSTLGDFNKHSALIVGTTEMGVPTVLFVFQYPGYPVMLTGTGRTALIYVVMNDDNFDDNRNSPTDPMRAHLG